MQLNDTRVWFLEHIWKIHHGRRVKSLGPTNTTTDLSCVFSEARNASNKKFALKQQNRNWQEHAIGILWEDQLGCRAWRNDGATSWINPADLQTRPYRTYSGIWWKWNWYHNLSRSRVERLSLNRRHGGHQLLAPRRWLARASQHCHSCGDNYRSERVAVLSSEKSLPQHHRILDERPTLAGWKWQVWRDPKQAQTTSKYKVASNSHLTPQRLDCKEASEQLLSHVASELQVIWPPKAMTKNNYFNWSTDTRV